MKKSDNSVRISQRGDHETEEFFKNLEWLNTKEAAFYLRKSEGALRVMVHRGHIRARKFKGRLYFKKNELKELIETSDFTGGF